MICILWTLGTLFALLGILYFQMGIGAATLLGYALLAAGSYGGSPSTGLIAVWAVYTAVALALNLPPLRRALLTPAILGIFKKIMPPISKTEREALDAGTVYWEKHLFAGKPDWKALHAIPKPTLTAEEQAFLDGPVEKLCDMLDDWEITDQLHDLPPHVWDFLKKEKFFGMIITKEYGGLDFSALGHSEVVMKVASRSGTAGITVMVPNSLGPAELLLHYGTPEQKNRYLPGLAIGTEIPCFALTEPEAGSDATSIKASGIVEKGIFEGKEIIGIRMNWEKRYITLSSYATVMGLAFHLYDPKKLMGDNEYPGITVALIPTNTKGITIGPRHDPLSIPFINGPIWGKDVFVPLDYIVGGKAYAGQGWRMLMERLGIGRGISLPAVSAASSKVACRGVGAYARIRRQFRMPVAKFEGVEEALAEMAGLTYGIDSARLFTVNAINQGEAPSLASAISKYSLTERCREVVNHAMDVQGGAAIVLGPRNFMGRMYQGLPVSITVEGANILTRTLIVFGQGIIRAHPWVLKEMEATADTDKARGLAAFDKAFFGHVGFTFSVAARAFVSAITCGVFLPSPVEGPLAVYYRRIGRFSAAFAIAADMAMLTLAGNLKRKEKLAGRLADIVSNLYIASATLKRYADDHMPKEDLPLVGWAIEDALYRAQEALAGFLQNLPSCAAACLLKLLIFPFGKPFNPPSDKLGAKAAETLQKPSDTRDRLTNGIHRCENMNEQLGRIEDALHKSLAAEEVERKISHAVKDKRITARGEAERIDEAVKNNIITAGEKAAIEVANKTRRDVIMVDDFPVDYWSKRDGK